MIVSIMSKKPRLEASGADAEECSLTEENSTDTMHKAAMLSRSCLMNELKDESIDQIVELLQKECCNQPGLIRKLLKCTTTNANTMAEILCCAQNENCSIDDLNECFKRFDIQTSIYDLLDLRKSSHASYPSMAIIPKEKLLNIATILDMASSGRMMKIRIADGLGYEVKSQPEKLAADEIRDMLEAAKRRGYTIGRLQKVLDDLNIKHQLYALTTDSTTKERMSTLVPRREKEDVNDLDAPTAHTSQQVIPTGNPFMPIMEVIAKESHSVPWLEVICFRCYKDVLQVYVEIHGGEHRFRAAEELIQNLLFNYQTAPTVKVVQNSPPRITTSAGPGLDIGKRLACQNLQATVGGYLKDRDNETYAISVGHVFPPHQVEPPMCFLFEGHQSHIGQCVCKLYNVEDNEGYSVNSRKLYLDVSLIKLSGPIRSLVSNAIMYPENRHGSNGAANDRWLTPRVYRGDMAILQPGLMVLVWNLTREEYPSRGRIYFVEFNNPGIHTNLIGIESVDGTPLTVAGDSGSLLTSMPVHDSDHVDAYGLIVGRDPSVALPLRQQLSHLSIKMGREHREEDFEFVQLE